jgi:hypothetical protein
VCEALESDDFEVRVDALRALEKQQAGDLAAYAPALLQVLLTFEKLASEDVDYPDPEERPEEKMRKRAFKLLRRVDPSELVEHMKPVFAALSDSDGPVTVREMGMKAVSLLPPAAVAPHAQLVMHRMREPDDEQMRYHEEDCEIGPRMRETASKVLSRLELPVLAGLLPELLAALEDDFLCDDALRVLSKPPPAMLPDHIRAVVCALCYGCKLLYSQQDAGLRILGQMVRAALAAHTDVLEEALCHSISRIQISALHALQKFPRASIAVHAATLRDMLAVPDCSSIQALAVELLTGLPGRALADRLATLPAQPKVLAGLLQALGKLPASASAALPPAAVQGC